MSLPDYDIAGGVPVGRIRCPLSVISRFAASAAAASPGQFSRERIIPGINIHNSRSDGGFVRPTVGIEPLGGLAQAFSLFGRPGSPGDPVTEFCVPRTQSGRFSAP